MLSFTKLWSSILDSTIWGEPYPTRIVWITMLSMADRDGVVMASIPGLANRAQVTIDECKTALERFFAPDEYSRTTDHEGRRIEKVHGGWRLLNHAYYRDLQSKESARQATAERVRRFRERHRSGCNNTEQDVTECNTRVTKSNIGKRYTYTYADTEGSAANAAGCVLEGSLPSPPLSDPLPLDATHSVSIVDQPTLPEVRAVGSTVDQSAAVVSREESYSATFESFWAAYPRHKRVGKRDAWRAWQRAQKGGRLPALEVLLRAIETQRGGAQWRRGYIPNPGTWLNGSRWADEVEMDGMNDADAATPAARQVAANARAIEAAFIPGTLARPVCGRVVDVHDTDQETTDE